MTLNLRNSIVGSMILLASCGPSEPTTAERFTEDCLRIVKTLDLASETDVPKICSCLVDGFEESISNEEFEQVASAFKNSVNEFDLEDKLEDTLSEALFDKTSKTARTCIAQ